MRTDYTKKISAEFDTTWKFSDKYQIWIVDHILKFLPLTAEDFLVDIGGGTGRIITMLQQHVKFQQSPLCIDPAEEMLAVAASNGINAMHCGALEFAQQEIQYNYAIMKECIHFVPAEKLIGFFWNIYQQLLTSGKILIITRPRNTTLALFTAAHDLFYATSHDHKIVVDAMQNSGLEVTITKDTCPLDISLNQWCDSLRTKSMSIMHSFSADEISAGISELQQQYPQDYQLLDTMYFICGSKS